MVLVTRENFDNAQKWLNERKAEIDALTRIVEDYRRNWDAHDKEVIDMGQKVKDLEAELKKKDSDIESLCFLLQMIHDKVPHGPGIHQPIRDAIAQYKPKKEGDESGPNKDEG
jgi:seryl-tRNA synthetase